MSLAVEFPVKPMLAKRAAGLPKGDGWIFEPKWDGFRALVFRDGDELTIQSRDLKPFNRYFPELLEPLKTALPDRCVVDGEIVIARDGRLQFEDMLQRIHPAKSRVDMLAEKTPASIVLFDMLVDGDDDLTTVGFGGRRARLAGHLEGVAPPVYVTPATTDREVAADWFSRFEGAGLDGVMAKAEDGEYLPGKRAMVKIKHQRTMDAVVAGYRWHKNGPGTHVGSLLLGLWGDDGRLHSIGVVAAFPMARRAALVEALQPWRMESLEGHPWAEWASAAPDGQRRPGGHSRWNAGKSLEWVALRPERVVEVRYDHMQGTRLRHTAQFERWRDDKPASECTYEQCEVVPPIELSQIFEEG